MNYYVLTALARDNSPNSRVNIIVSQTGILKSRTILSGAIHVSGAGLMSNISLGTSASTIIYSGGTTTSTTVNSGGSMWVSSGGKASYITVSSTGYLEVASGGSATIYRSPHMGSVISNIGAYINYINTGVIDYISNNNIISTWEYSKDNFTVVNYHSAVIYNGAVMNSTTINSYGRVHVSSGGTANSTTANPGWLVVQPGGTANNVTVSEYGRIRVSSGGTATNIVATEHGYIDLAVAPNTYIQGTSGGSAFLMENAYISGYVVNYQCILWVASDGIASDTIIASSGYQMYVSSGGTANGITVNSGGSLTVYRGGVANNIISSTGAHISYLRGAIIDGVVIT